MAGPFIQENWQLFLKGQQWKEAFEYPLFTDAHIVGDMVEYGPYRLINTIAYGEQKQTRPSIVLRALWFIEPSLPNWEATNDERYHGGWFADEVAALVSLCLGIRLRAGSENRVFRPDGDPMGRPIAYGLAPEPKIPQISLQQNLVLPYHQGQRELSDSQLLETLPSLPPEDALVLVRAARLYQEAVWVAETEPERSWLLLTSAVETAANRWRSTEEPPVERLRASRPQLEKLLRDRCGDDFVEEVAAYIAPYMGATRKFIDFLLEFLPPPPQERPPSAFQVNWNASHLKKVFAKVYKHRSRALHGGIPFPAPMCAPPISVERQFVEKPAGLAASALGGVWRGEDIPIHLHTFEYIVRGALLNWWGSLTDTA